MHHALPSLHRCLLVTMLLGNTALFGQGYAPFDPSQRKLFASPDHRGFSLAFDSTTTDGNGTQYFNFCAVWDTLTPSNCPWWGGPECHTQDRPTWLGRRIDRDGVGFHTFHNLWNEGISIPFHTDDQDTLLMYADPGQQFLLSYAGAVSMSVLGQIDSVRQWTIHHRDLANNPINSALNGASIEVGKELGLIRSFRIDSFPLILEPMELMGSEYQAIGLYRITAAMLEDHQPGDEMQTHSWSQQSGGPPWNNYSRYHKRIFLSRTDTPDSVIYSVRTESFDEDVMVMVFDTIIEKYSRAQVIATVPFERYDGTQPVFEERSYCGMDLWKYQTFYNTGLAYCPEENCWGPYDTNGPPPFGGSTQVIGLGLLDSHSFIWTPNGLNSATTVVYFKKNGITCMNEVALGTSTATSSVPIVELMPNPTSDMVNFRATTPVSTVMVYNGLGRSVFEANPFSMSGGVDLSGNPAGVYFVQMRFANGSIGTQRVIRQ